ncbi:MAG: TonB-dependent receptor [Lysobacterales bacterium]|jgi:outer membrane receptor protein involved in Fe transport
MNVHRKMFNLTLSSAVTATLALTGTTAVQADEDVLEEVIVTANKREQTVQDIPMNISVLDALMIEERGIYRPEDYLRTLAGVSTPGGDANFIIRGLNTSTAQRSAGTTSTFVDEIALGLTNLYDIERIEVLRGPQGTLYGASAVGGTIRYITNKPDASEFAGNVTLEYVHKKMAENSGYTVNAMLNIPLAENLALRAVGTLAEDPGIYQNVATGRKDVGTQEDDEYRVALRWTPGNADIMLSYIYRDRSDFGQKETGNADKPGTADIIDPNCAYDTAWYYGDACTRVWATSGGDLSGYDPELAFFSFIDETYDVETSVITLNASYDFGPVTGTLIYADYSYDEYLVTDWSRIDTDDLYIDNLYLWGDSGEETLEVRFTSSYDGPIQWTAGYFSNKFDDAGDRVQEWEQTDMGGMDYIQWYMAFDSHPCTGDNPWPSGYGGCYDPSFYRYPFGSNEFRGLSFDGGLVYGSYIYYSYAEEEAFYGEIDWNIGALTLTFGIRDFELSDGFKVSEYGIFYEDPDNTGCDGNEPVGVTCAEENGKESDQRFKFAAAYEFTDNVTVFGVWSEGYRPGGNNAALPFFCANDPEAAGFRRRYTSDRAENTELGVKWRGSRFNVNATVFKVDWQDIQVGVRPACGWSFIYNGGEAETSGLELDFGFDITDKLRMDVAASIISAEITSDIPTLDATAGDRLPNVAEKQASVGFSYPYEIFGMPGFSRLDINYYGDSYATFAEDPEDMSPSYTQANLNLGLQILDNTRLQLTIANLTDERTEAFRFSANSPSYRPRNYLQWIPPRTIAVSAAIDF